MNKKQFERWWNTLSQKEKELYLAQGREKAARGLEGKIIHFKDLDKYLAWLNEPRNNIHAITPEKKG